MTRKTQRSYSGSGAGVSPARAASDAGDPATRARRPVRQARRPPHYLNSHDPATKAARKMDWEHGLIGGRDRHTAMLKGRFLFARGEAEAPDIDGRVYLRGQLPLGELARVKVIGHTDYDLVAEPA